MKLAEEKTNFIRWQTVDHLDIALSIKRDVFFSIELSWEIFIVKESGVG